MADGPSHFVLIEKDDAILRRLGPMHLGRAHRVKSNLEHLLKEGESMRVIDNDNFDPETGQEKSNVDSNEESGRESKGRDDRRHSDGPDNSNRPWGEG